jgi:hypothetical protein
MILVLGQIADPVLANVCARLAARRADLLLIHPDEEGEGLEFSWSTDGDAHFREVLVGTRRIPISQLTAVFVRGMASTQATTPKGQAMITAMWELVDSLPVLVANRRTGSHSNMSKPYQQHLIAREGFMTPRTIITMQAEEAKTFYDICDGRVIYKSISAERSIVKSLSKEDFPLSRSISRMRAGDRLPRPYGWRSGVCQRGDLGRQGLSVCRARRGDEDDAGGRITA